MRQHAYVSPFETFLAANGYANIARVPVTTDWSPRKFSRMVKPNGTRAIVVESAPDTAPQSTAGHKIGDFVRLADHFRRLGLSAPIIYAAEPDQGWLIMEDLGDVTIDTPAIEHIGYETAIDVLAHMRNHPDACDTPLIDYADGHVANGLDQFLLYAPQIPLPDWQAAWRAIEAQCPPCPRTLTHIDYKAGNLLWLPERNGLQRLGIIDLQGAVSGPFVYDVVNLLEDARRIIAPDLKAHLIARFKAALPMHLTPLFAPWYTVLSAQFHARVLGQITRIEKMRPNTVDPTIAPRLEQYLRAEITAPLLAPLHTLLKDHACLLQS